MSQPFDEVEFKRCLVAGIFAGIAATVLSMIFNLAFRNYTGFTLSMVINVNSIIFILGMTITLSGIIFYYFHHHLKYGTLVFRVFAFIITMVLIFVSQYIVHNEDPEQARLFRQLLMGIVVIMGGCIMLLLPLLYKKDVL